MDDPRLLQENEFLAWLEVTPEGQIRQVMSKAIDPAGYTFDQTVHVATSTMLSLPELNAAAAEDVLDKLVERLFRLYVFDNASKSSTPQERDVQMRLFGLMDKILAEVFSWGYLIEGFGRSVVLQIALTFPTEFLIERMEKYIADIDVDFGYLVSLTTADRDKAKFFLKHCVDRRKQISECHPTIGIYELSGSQFKIADWASEALVFRDSEDLIELLSHNMLEHQDAIFVLTRAVRAPSYAEADLPEDVLRSRSEQVIEALLAYAPSGVSVRDRLHASLHDEVNLRAAEKGYLVVTPDLFAVRELFCGYPDVTREFCSEIIFLHNMDSGAKTGVLQQALLRFAGSGFWRWKESLAALVEAGLDLKAYDNNWHVLNQLAVMIKTKGTNADHVVDAMIHLLTAYGLAYDVKDDNGYTPLSHMGKFKDSKAQWGDFVRSYEAKVAAEAALAELMS